MILFLVVIGVTLVGALLFTLVVGLIGPDIGYVGRHRVTPLRPEQERAIGSPCSYHRTLGGRGSKGNGGPRSRSGGAPLAASSK
ncbi:hypothetical protein [Actinomadura litoris]|uniref:Uncharacterized protein n=1 Tax=Actinomadura litoris TaxID=2678616 RepID=A0A7K1L681_9ACTN|nr:hypothetical protein [Actinomadura litoris]MUN39803.1 hypothetical protein [Actinomadura litoris]